MYSKTDVLGSIGIVPVSTRYVFFYNGSPAVVKYLNDINGGHLYTQHQNQLHNLRFRCIAHSNCKARLIKVLFESYDIFPFCL